LPDRPNEPTLADPGAAEPGAPVQGGSEAVGANVARRRFFRQFAGELVQGAATLVGAAQVLRESSAQAAAAILDPQAGGVASPVPSTPATSAAGGPPSGFRTPFRFGDRDDVLLLVDQRRLPEELVEFEVRSAVDAAYAIREMIVRGAPAIGQVAALGLALTAHRARGQRPYARRANLRGAAQALASARPTAVNARWAVDRMVARFEAIGGVEADGDLAAETLRAEADAIVWEATNDHGRIAEFGLAQLPRREAGPLQLLTHCNTGPLACGQFGTALGVVQAAHNADWPLHVWVDETRPYLQGARLTAWELQQAGVPHTLIADVAAGYLLSRGEVDAILVGADRIAANGDTANKVGTYALAVLAQRHGVPFFVVAPLSSVDRDMPDGDAIPIEERPADEVLIFRGRAIAPPGTEARNPAFDVTPAELITSIVTEEGALRAPFEPAIQAAFERSRVRRAAQPAPFPAGAGAAAAPAAAPASVAAAR